MLTSSSSCFLLIFFEIIFQSKSQLRYNWRNGTRFSKLAELIESYQSDCTKMNAKYELMTNGLGSDLHVWSQALCSAMNLNSGLYTNGPDKWAWNDDNYCKNKTFPPFQCYFNKIIECDPTHQQIVSMNQMSMNHAYDACPTYITNFETRQEFRRAAMEYLFSHISEDIIDDAETTYSKMFGNTTNFDNNNIITIHVRWSDKYKEMKLVKMETYVSTISDIIATNNITDPQIILITEDMKAVHEMRRLRHDAWTVHEYSEPSISPHISHGVIGRFSLIGVIVALQANHYVITTGSNWSRLINELRINIIDEVCGNCTTMVDLSPGDW